MPLASTTAWPALVAAVLRSAVVPAVVPAADAGVEAGVEAGAVAADDAAVLDAVGGVEAPPAQPDRTPVIATAASAAPKCLVISCSLTRAGNLITGCPVRRRAVK